ncbi:MAG: hypothetical protein N2C13_04310 [Chloroflexota bacterium]
MKRRYLGWFVFVMLAATLTLSACQSEPAPAEDAEVISEQPALPFDSEDGSADVTEMVVEPDESVIYIPIFAAQVTFLGQVLVDDKGWTLYIFLNDEEGVSNCNDNCANNWPPLPADGELVAGDGLDASLLGAITRADGTTQVTYNGHPLYYYLYDVKAGDANGQGARDVWYVISPTGEMVGPAATALTIALAEITDLGQGLVDNEGWTLYIFLNDADGTSNCNDSCANNWPALLADEELVVGDGLDASLLGTITRADGTTQVTYNGHPLYYYIDDIKPGDANGQGTNEVWYAISPTGEPVGAEE